MYSCFATEQEGGMLLQNMSSMVYKESQQKPFEYQLPLSAVSTISLPFLPSVTESDEASTSARSTDSSERAHCAEDNAYAEFLAPSEEELPWPSSLQSCKTEARTESTAEPAAIQFLSDADHSVRKGHTEVVVQGLPKECTLEAWMRELSDAGYRKHLDYDGLIFPKDGKTGYSKGYCLMSFVNVSTTRAFTASFQGMSCRNLVSKVPMQVTPYDI